MTITESAKIIQRFYGLNLPVSPEDAQKEIANLRRKQAKGSLDSFDEVLAARLRLDRIDLANEAHKQNVGR